MTFHESLSLEETNKDRIKLGLKPLVPETKDPETHAVPVLDEEQQAIQNFKQLHEEQAKIAQEKDLNRRIQKVRNKFKLHERLSGPTLGDATQNKDLKSWIKRTKKQERALAATREQELECQEQMVEESYTSRQIDGLTVGHDFADIEEGEEMILTIKDMDVLDEDDDVLISTALAEKQRLKENLENKVRKPKYNPYAEDDYIGGEKRILAKYDEEMKKTFTIGKEQEHLSPMEESSTQWSIHLIEDTLDFSTPMEIASDYVDISSIKIKKPKKKVKKHIKLSEVFGDEGLLPSEAIVSSTEMTDNVTPIPLFSTKHTHNEDSGLGDDDELQELLAQRRRRALKKKNVSRVEDIAQSVRETAVEEEYPFSSGDGLVFDETTHFVGGLRLPTVEEEIPRNLKNSDPDEMDIHKEFNSPPNPFEMGEPRPTNNQNPIQDEPIICHTLASTFASLVKSGELSQSSLTSSQLSHRTSVLQSRRLRALAQESHHPPTDSPHDRRPQKERDRDREWRNRQRDVEETYRRLEEFEGYKFNVDLERRSEYGHEMSEKEAYKELSRRFHGMGSGTMKKGKRLEKAGEMRKGEKGKTSVDELRRVMKQREEQKKMGSAHIRLN